MVTRKRPGAAGSVAVQAPLPDVSVETFTALDMRVGRILDVHPFPEARHPAWKLTVDLGQLGTRRTSAQLTHYPAEQLANRLVVAAVNLGPKRVAGFVSECLVLAAVGDDGYARLLRPDEGATPGDRVA